VRREFARELTTNIAPFRGVDGAALRASELRYRTLFNSIDEGFCITEMKTTRPIAPSTTASSR
jgi:hypothetical protein